MARGCAGRPRASAKQTVVRSLERVGERELARLASRGFALSATEQRDERAANDDAFRAAAKEQRFVKYFVKHCPELVAAIDHGER